MPTPECRKPVEVAGRRTLLRREPTGGRVLPAVMGPLREAAAPPGLVAPGVAVQVVARMAALAVARMAVLAARA
jgi:hypothetical protein